MLRITLCARPIGPQFVLLVAQLIWANQGWPYELDYNDIGRAC